RQVEMRIGMREIAADSGDVAHAHIGERLHRAWDHRQLRGDLARMLERGEGRHRADAEGAAVGRKVDAGEHAVKAAQTDEAARPVHLRLHHQHQSGTAADRAHCGVFGIEQGKCLVQRGRFENVETGHLTPVQNRSTLPQTARARTRYPTSRHANWSKESFHQNGRLSTYWYVPLLAHWSTGGPSRRPMQGDWAGR